MGMRRMLLACAGTVALIAGMGGAEAKGTGPTTIRDLRVTHHVRVDGSSDLRGSVKVRGGLKVTAGLSTDTIDTSGPVQIGGVLLARGGITGGSLSAGQGAIQGGTLALSGNATIAGNLQLSQGLSAGSVIVGSGGLQASSISSSGALAAGSITTTGVLTAGSINDQGSLSAGSGAFSRLSVASGGTVNFNNATVTGLVLTGQATLSSLQINSVAGGGSGGTQALTITQNGQTASLSVDGSANLAVAGNGLTTPALTVANNASVGGTLTTSKISSSSQIALNAPTVSTSAGLQVGAGGNLQLMSTASAAAHLAGNHDTRGQCTASASGQPDVNSCSITFADSYNSAPVVVVTPAGTDPTFVINDAVQSSSGGFTIRFQTTGPGTVTFNYIVES